METVGYEERMRMIRDDLKEEDGKDIFYKSENAEKACSMMLHAIGWKRGNKGYHRHGKHYYKPYRNYYDAGPGDVVYWDALVTMGYAKTLWNESYYKITRSGLDWLGSRIGVIIKEEQQ